MLYITIHNKDVYTHTDTHTYICVYMCDVWVCVYVCVDIYVYIHLHRGVAGKYTYIHAYVKPPSEGKKYFYFLRKYIAKIK